MYAGNVTPGGPRDVSELASLTKGHVRGHTDGSVAFAYATPAGHTHPFTGDSLFPGGVGNTRQPGQSYESLFAPEWLERGW